MANISVSYTFSNSTTADATQVNTNFTDIINGTSDGTKDFSINALTCAGAATLNGNVTLGNSTSDDVTITGSLASTIPVKTTYSYDIGSTTIGLRSIYLGSADSAARGTRLIGATVAAGYTLTLPTSGGTIGQFPVTDGSGTLSFRYPDKVTAKTANYTATGDESVINCDASSGAFTITLPAAASFTGKRYVIKKTDSSANGITIDGNSSELLDGDATLPIKIQYEAVEIVSDGSNWHVVSRGTPYQVYARASNSTTALSSTPATVIFATEDDDTHAAFNLATSEFTVPRNGRVRVSAYVLGPASTWTAVGEGLQLLLYRDGSLVCRLGSQTVGGAVTGQRMAASGSTYLKCTSGQVLTVRASNDISGSIPSGADLAWVCYEMD